MLYFCSRTVSAAFQSLPGPQITATYTATNAQIAPSLGHTMSAGVNGTANLQLITPGTLFGDRLNQLDLRGSKIFRIANGRSIQANVDLYNAPNVDTVLALNNTFGPLWQKPASILQARFFKFSVQFQF